MLEAWVSVLHETTNSFPDEFISKSAIQVSAKNKLFYPIRHEHVSMLPSSGLKLNFGHFDKEEFMCQYFVRHFR